MSRHTATEHKEAAPLPWVVYVLAPNKQVTKHWGGCWWWPQRAALQPLPNAEELGCGLVWEDVLEPGEVLQSSGSTLKHKNKVCKLLTLAAPICSFRNFSKGVMSTSLAFSIWWRKAGGKGKISHEVQQFVHMCPPPPRPLDKTWAAMQSGCHCIKAPSKRICSATPDGTFLLWRVRYCWWQSHCVVQDSLGLIVL